MTDTIHEYLDCVGNYCAEPKYLIETKIQSLAPGEILEAIFADLSDINEIKVFCTKLGCEITKIKHYNDGILFVLKRT